ncbi:MAG: MlaD family protein, partial [Planctomycetota bacterium]
MKRSRDFLTGVVFFGLLVVLGFFTVILANIRIGEVPEMTIAFAEVDGLEAGHDVRVDGYRCGRAREMEIQPHVGRILVTIEFEEKPDIFVGAEFNIIPASPLGGRVLSIHNPEAEKRGEFISFRAIQ